MIQINEFFDRQQADRLLTYFEELVNDRDADYQLRLKVYRDDHLDGVVWVQMSARIGETSVMQRRAVSVVAMKSAMVGTYQYICEEIQSCLAQMRDRIDALDEADDLIVTRL